MDVIIKSAFLRTPFILKIDFMGFYCIKYIDENLLNLKLCWKISKMQYSHLIINFDM